ncbi:hypothetical protein BGP75_24505 [Motiliproteus sp. MSK22-1]|nr:hypothetical protein BGP75_24505 [Motiliproteus sp. MSK22-1]
MLLLVSVSTLFLTGCGGNGFSLKNLAKSDIDMVTDIYIREQYFHTRELMTKLYKRNPRELTKNPGYTINKRLKQLGRTRSSFRFPELGNKVGNDALNLVFDEAFKGDRVFALLVGIRSSLHASYNQKSELYLLDELDQQKLYNSARNLEIIAWRLRAFRQADGTLFLLSNGYQDGIPNLSYERLFGKMIGLQDMMAKIVSGKNDRTINTVVHGMATTALLPIGI